MDTSPLTGRKVMYRKSLLALMILAAIPVTAATDTTLYVTTFEDEDGENSNTCSLREAIKAAKDKRAYGGCIAGQANVTNQIQLKAGVYKLKKPLIINSSVTISGDDAFNYDRTDAYTSSFPARSDLQTTIEGNGSFSLFDSTNSRSTLSFNTVILKNGGGAYGGAIRAGGLVNLNRVYILDSTAERSGGAIYLEGSEATLTAADTLFEGNNADRGAVIGMSCVDNIKWTPHSIILDRNSIIRNGGANTQNIIEFCGSVTSTISASTIANNKSRDAIIKFTDDTSRDYILSPSSSLVLNSNTIVENIALSTLLYDMAASLNLSNNVIAYNNGGKSCRYAGDSSPEDFQKMDSSNVTAYYNAVKKPIEKTSRNDDCDLPGHLYKADTSKFVDVSSISFASVLSDLSDIKDGILPFYLPKPKPEGATVVTLVDAGEASCSALDQRGVLRSGPQSSNTRLEKNKCDIGSVEISRLQAGDVIGVGNNSVVQRTKQYERNIDYYESILDSDSLDKKLISRYKQLLEEEEQAFKAFKATLAYRQAYVDVFEMSTSQEVYNAAQTATTVERFEDDKYNIKVEALGRGAQQFIERPTDTSLIDVGQKANISCKWEPVLKQILVRRTDNVNGKPYAVTTPSGEYEYCKYTLSLKSDPSVTSTGYVQAQIINIAPIANDDTFYIKYGSNQKLELNILANDNDDGDGGVEVKGYPSQHKPFFQDPETGRYANIKLVKKPELGQLIFEHQQPCPDNSSSRPEETCYGGKLVYQADNTFSTFNDSFSYKVLDQDLMESNEATVKITNTATTSDDTRNSGGGSFGIAGLLGLMGLAWLRRRG
ncbi:CSLREA domain-containing protein [Alkanindiges sp. WGS2144]|uniref:CSLREA domain-containing protein n=1 Tax=Alkanindiges sp. WGS2144 TaxID=3366808 RepID=UPI003751D9EA